MVGVKSDREPVEPLSVLWRWLGSSNPVYKGLSKRRNTWKMTDKQNTTNVTRNNGSTFFQTKERSLVGQKKKRCSG